MAKAYAKLIRPLRSRAKELGYAIGVHGSLKRDIDLIACPWAEEAVDAECLAEELRLETERVIGFAVYGNDGPFPRSKPFGRRGWTIHFNGTYIDLSVMPREGDTMSAMQSRTYPLLNPQAVVDKIAAVNGPKLDPTQPTGEVEAHGCKLSWTIAPATLGAPGTSPSITVTIVDKPFYVSSGEVWSQLDKLFA